MDTDHEFTKVSYPTPIGPATSGKYLYVVACDHTNRCKVGVSNDPNRRVASMQTGSPTPLRVAHCFYVFPVSLAFDIERAVHVGMRRLRLHGEWFDLPANEASVFVDLVGACHV